MYPKFVSLLRIVGQINKLIDLSVCKLLVFTGCNWHDFIEEAETTSMMSQVYSSDILHGFTDMAIQLPLFLTFDREMLLEMLLKINDPFFT